MINRRDMLKGTETGVGVALGASFVPNFSRLPLLGRALANASYSSCRARVSIRRLAFRTG
jgi:hypothetical protein